MSTIAEKSKARQGEKFTMWCVEHGPRLLKLLTKESKKDGWTFKLKIEAPAKLGKSGIQLLIPVPDQLSRPDGSGPADFGSFGVYAAEVWKFLRGQWALTYDGMAADMRDALDRFRKTEPRHAALLMEALVCDDEAETFMFAGGVESSVTAFQTWMARNENVSGQPTAKE